MVAVSMKIKNQGRFPDFLLKNVISCDIILSRWGEKLGKEQNFTSIIWTLILTTYTNDLLYVHHCKTGGRTMFDVQHLAIYWPFLKDQIFLSKIKAEIFGVSQMQIENYMT